MTRLAALPYHADSTQLFERIADEPWAVFLDSGAPQCTSGRFDILAARPRATLVCEADACTVAEAEHTRASGDDPFQLLRELLALKDTKGAATRPEEAADLPFSGGALGYFAYDLAQRLDRLPVSDCAADPAMPLMAVGIYDWAVVVDHLKQRSWLASASDCLAAPEWAALVALFSAGSPEAVRPAFTAQSDVRPSFTSARYAAAFKRVADYIREGDCYQVNLAQRFSTRVSGDPWMGYRRLRAINPAPFSAYLNLPHGKLLSSSPERFLNVRAGQVETRPIKGTRPRAADPEQDAANARALSESSKDRAENLMIVDLLRNDLGRVCATGSIQAPRLFEVESFANVHHLVSTVTGHLAPDKDVLDLLRASFPGGSITGSPKRRAMEIIAELEPSARGVYCGAIGYIGFNGDMDTNIAIRTLEVVGENARFWAGGGLVADSQVAAEYQECIDKAAPLLQLFAAQNTTDP